MQAKSNGPGSRTLTPVKGAPGIFKRGSRYVVRTRDPRGRQLQRAARTLKEARGIRSALQADVARGEYREVSHATFESYARSWIDTYQGRTSKGIRSATLTDYRREIETHAIPFLGSLRLAEVEPRHLKDRKSTRLNSSHIQKSRMPSSA